MSNESKFDSKALKEFKDSIPIILGKDNSTPPDNYDAWESMVQRRLEQYGYDDEIATECMLMVMKGQCAIWFHSYLTTYRNIHGKSPSTQEACAACREQYGNESFDEENVQNLLDLQSNFSNKEIGITKFLQYRHLLERMNADELILHIYIHTLPPVIRNYIFSQKAKGLDEAMALTRRKMKELEMDKNVSHRQNFRKDKFNSKKVFKSKFKQKAGKCGYCGFIGHSENDCRRKKAGTPNQSKSTAEVFKDQLHSSKN